MSDKSDVNTICTDLNNKFFPKKEVRILIITIMITPITICTVFTIVSNKIILTRT
jgi:hypothetical protein